MTLLPLLQTCILLRPWPGIRLPAFGVQRSLHHRWRVVDGIPLLEIDNFNVPVAEETVRRRPSVRASDLLDPKELDKLINALDWFVEQVSAA